MLIYYTILCSKNICAQEKLQDISLKQCHSIMVGVVGAFLVN